MAGFFVSFEGIDKSGKSTQAALLDAHFRRAGRSVVLTHEPGGTELGRELRHLLLTWKPGGVQPEAEILLFAADRAQHVAEVIRPALRAESVVICDRYVDSTLAYQGYGHGLDLAKLGAVQAVATGGLMPHVTVWVDVPVATFRTRLGALEKDRMEEAPDAFYERVRGGYAALCAEEPTRLVRVDGEKPVERLFQDVLDAVTARMSEEHSGRGNV